MISQTVTTIIAIAAFLSSSLAGPQPDKAQSDLVGLTTHEGFGNRIDMRVTLLQAGADAAAVELVLSRPTTVSEGSVNDSLTLAYADEPIRTRVTMIGGHVTAIALDLFDIDPALLPTQARRVKPMMVRAGVLALLGNPI